MSEVFKTFNSGEKKITTAVTHKDWLVTKANSGSYGVKTFVGKAVHGTFNPADDLMGTALDEQTTTSSGSTYFKKLVYDGIAHLYYTGNDNPYDVFCNDNPHTQIRELNDYVTVWSIPSSIYGEKIKPGTFQYSQSLHNSTHPSFIASDDGLGNLFDAADTSGSYVREFNKKYAQFHIGLWDSYKNAKNINISSCSIKSEATFPNDPIAYDVKFVDSPHGRGIAFHGSMSYQQGGHSSTLHNHDNSIIRVKDSRVMELDYSKDMSSVFTFWVNIPVSQSVTQSFNGPWLNPGNGEINSRASRNYNTNVIATKAEWFGRPTPWELLINNSYNNNAHKGKLEFRIGSKAADGGGLNTVRSSNTINDGNWHHVSIVVENATKVKMFIDGTERANQSISLGSQPNMRTTSDIYFGARPYGYKTKVFLKKYSKYHWDRKNRNYIKPFSGSIDEFRIYNMTSSAMTDFSKFSNCASASFNGSNLIGNIMYEHGLATFTTPLPTVSSKTQYHGQADNPNWSISFQGTHKIKEHLYICNVLDGEFNATYNTTARVNTDDRNDNLQAYTTHSEFNPYVTTIGLYDDYNNLVAVGKLAQPIKNQDDYDNTFQVRFDTTI